MRIPQKLYNIAKKISSYLILNWIYKNGYTIKLFKSRKINIILQFCFNGMKNALPKRLKIRLLAGC